MKIKVFEPCIAEFGWELCAYQGICRKVAEDYEYTVVTSFKGMAPLYKDFVSEFLEHNRTSRSLDFPGKMYHSKKYGKWIKYGNPRNVCDVLIHARHIRRGADKNYLHWDKISVPNSGFIGTHEDLCLNDRDYRDLPLQDLMDKIAGARVVIGGSSGVMHLAMLCGTPIICWGDARTYFGETLEKRYKDTWNFFDSPVHWIHCGNWQPNPDDIYATLRDVL
jgi:hypothetical protein